MGEAYYAGLTALVYLNANDVSTLRRERNAFGRTGANLMMTWALFRCILSNYLQRQREGGMFSSPRADTSSRRSLALINTLVSTRDTLALLRRPYRAASFFNRFSPSHIWLSFNIRCLDIDGKITSVFHVSRRFCMDLDGLNWLAVAGVVGWKAWGKSSGSPCSQSCFYYYYYSGATVLGKNTHMVLLRFKKNTFWLFYWVINLT